MIEFSQEDFNIFCDTQNSILEYFEDVSHNDLISKNNKHEASLARGYLWYILHYEKDFSINKIATYYNRSKRGVSRLISKTKYLIDYQKKYGEIYETIYPSNDDISMEEN